MSLRLHRCLICAAALLSAPLASAQSAAESVEESVAQARQWFAEAEALEATGQWQAAIDRLRQALTVKETPGLRYHLAFCQAQLGQLVEALANYDRARELLDAGVHAEDVAVRLASARTELQRRIPTLALELRTRVPGVRWRVDDRELPAPDPPQPVRLDPGTYAVVVSAPGRRPFELVVTLREGDRKVVHADLEPAPPASMPAPPAQPGPARPERDAGSDPSARTAVLVTGSSLSLVALGVGVGYGIARSNAAERAEDARAELDRRDASGSHACTDPSPDIVAACARLDEANRDGIAASRIATWGFVGAGVAAAATVATFLLWDDTEIGVAPVGVAGVSCRVRGAF